MVFKRYGGLKEGKIAWIPSRWLLSDTYPIKLYSTNNDSKTFNHKKIIDSYDETNGDFIRKYFRNQLDPTNGRIKIYEYKNYTQSCMLIRNRPQWWFWIYSNGSPLTWSLEGKKEMSDVVFWKKCMRSDEHPNTCGKVRQTSWLA